METLENKTSKTIRNDPDEKLTSDKIESLSLKETENQSPNISINSITTNNIKNLIDLNVNKFIEIKPDKTEIKINSITNKTNSFENSELEIEAEERAKIEDLNKGVKEIRIAVIGNVDSGKSTLVGVLSKCVLDDGRGAARQLVFNYEHEKENGRTSSIAWELMGFKATEQIQPIKTSDKKNTAWTKIMKESDKVISIIDLCGHEKYLKTTIFGLTGLVPDYALIVIGANMGVQRMTKEHLGIALALKIPLFIVITKIDIAPAEIYKQTLDYITKVLKSTGTQKLPVVVRESDDISVYAESILFDRICPIFCVSSVTGEGLKPLRIFMSLLKTRSGQQLNNTLKPTSDKAEFLLDCSYNVKGVGLIVSGTLVSGKIAVGNTLMLGPDLVGEFKPVKIKSIHYKRLALDEISAGNSCCFHIKSKDNIKQSDLRKGMVLVDKEANLRPCWEFEAEVVILHHATLIKPKYQAVIHCGVVRQTAIVVSMSCDLLRTGDRGIVRFRFIKSPECLHEGATVLFREGRTRGVGQIKRLIYENKEKITK
jgi:GTPase